jgi:hypothetical protein
VQSREAWFQGARPQLVGRRINLLATAIELKNTGQSDLQKQSQLTHQMVTLSGETDLLLQEMKDVEERLLNLRTNRSEQLFRITTVILSATFALTLALFLIHYQLLHAELKERHQADAKFRHHWVHL